MVVKQKLNCSIESLSSILLKDIASRSLTSSRAGAHVGVKVPSAVLKKQKNLEKILEDLKQVAISPALTVEQLRRRCQKAGLPPRGTKAELLARLGLKKEDAE